MLSPNYVKRFKKNHHHWMTSCCFKRLLRRGHLTSDDELESRLNASLSKEDKTKPHCDYVSASVELT